MRHGSDAVRRAAARLLVPFELSKLSKSSTTWLSWLVLLDFKLLSSRLGRWLTRTRTPLGSDNSQVTVTLHENGSLHGH